MRESTEFGGQRESYFSCILVTLPMDIVEYFREGEPGEGH